MKLTDNLEKYLEDEYKMFSYRMCKAEDFDIWLEMNKAFMDEEIEDADLWNGTNENSNDSFKETFKGALESKDLITLMIFEEDCVPVGFANLMTIYSIWAHGKALILDDLYLKPEARGKGYGKCALKYIEEYSDASTERGRTLRKRIAEKFNFASLEFQSLEGIIEAIGLDKACLCTYCWNGKE